MKYFEVDFKLDGREDLFQDARDIISALAAESGFETFEETTRGLKGYVQQNLYDEDALKSQLLLFPFNDITISFDVKEAADEDWNAQWEEEGFEPIVIGNKCVIHDGRHLPISLQNFQLSIEIDTHLAFGTGTHQTTRMMVDTLLQMHLKGAHVLDCGCGTGILGIVALKLGAEKCVGYDIDEWSADNARHNSIINCVDAQYEALLGDAAVLKNVHEEFDVVMANINRNVLLNDMSVFVSKMKADGHLLLSGFYLQDIPLLENSANVYGLTLTEQKNEGEWACLHFKR